MRWHIVKPAVWVMIVDDKVSNISSKNGEKTSPPSPTPATDHDSIASHAVTRVWPVAAGITAMAIGGFWLVAWFSGAAGHWSASGAITVKTNMAVGQLLAGFALLLLARCGNSRGWRQLTGLVLAAVVLTLGSLTLFEHLFRLNLGIDQLLATEPSGAAATASPNRMGVPGSMSLVMLGLGLLALAWKGRKIAHYFGLAICLINLVPAVGFLYGINQFYMNTHLTSVAWPTVVAMLSLGTGLILTCTDSDLVLLRRDAGGMLLRKMLPVVILVPLILGYLRVQGQHRGLYETATGTGTLVIALVLIFSAMLWRSAVGLSASSRAERDAQEALRQNEQRLRAMFNNAGVGIVEVDSEDRFTAANERILEILGYSRDELLGMNVHQLTAPEDRDSSDKMNTRLHERELDRFDYEKRYIRRDGSPIWAHVTVSAVRDSDGHHLGAITTIEDISKRKQTEEEIRKLNAELEKRVTERTTELEDANKELEAFSYSVSHDLRAPLRAIDGFSSTLLKNYRDSLDERGRDYLDRVRRASQRMAQLIDDILGLSRAGRAEMHRQLVDLSATANDIARELQESRPDRQAQIIIAQDLVADADSHLLRIALNNLLGNAWKFTGNQDIACIELGAVEQNGERVYFIKDNGAGFNPAHADKLFSPFQRLHSESEFPGTGIGLALVQRVIRRHGGRIWAESEVGQGATFYFTLGEDNI